MRCPVCKKSSLEAFDRSATSTTLSCPNSRCKSIVTVKTKASKVIEVVVPGVVILSSIPSILNFFGISDIDDLLDLIDSFT